MKKFFALVTVALISIVGAFAFDITTVRGTWYDENYDADWTFSSNGRIVLSSHSSGKVLYTFDDSNVTNFRVNLQNQGDGGLAGQSVVIKFRCDATQRNYTFMYPVGLKNPLQVEFAPDWARTPYKATLNWLKGEKQ